MYGDLPAAMHPNGVCHWWLCKHWMQKVAAPVVCNTFSYTACRGQHSSRSQTLGGLSGSQALRRWRADRLPAAIGLPHSLPKAHRLPSGHWQCVWPVATNPHAVIAATKLAKRCYAKGPLHSTCALRCSCECMLNMTSPLWYCQSAVTSAVQIGRCH